MAEQIFISYRRKGGDVTAKLICEALKLKGYTVFYDFDSLHGGYFDERILDAIEGCDDFILVLPANSLDRCQDADDWVRQEIRHALKHGKNIVPVLLEGFSFPKDLPADICEVKRYNGVPFSMMYFDAMISTIAERLRAGSGRQTAKTTVQQSVAPKESEGLKFGPDKDGDGYRVIGTGICKDTEVIIPQSYQGKPVTSIGFWAFNGCTSLTSITIPESVTSIEDEAFGGCDSLTSITIPSSVTSIGDQAFENCTSLTSITIPSSVTSIGWWAFDGCTSLTEIKYRGTPEMWRAISFGIDWAKNVPATSVKCKNSINPGPAAKESEGLKFEPDEDGNGYLVADIGSCTDTEVVIPRNYQGKPVTSIGNRAFQNCTSLSSITIPSSVTSIGDWAFGGCSSLTSITIPSSVTSIENWAFYGCDSLTSITIPSSVTSIGDWAFDGCDSLTSIQVASNNPCFCSYDSHLYSKDMKTLVRYAHGCKNTIFTIPSSVTSIGGGAFYGCSSLEGITIPSSVTSIENWAFERCTSLEGITIPSSVTSIGNGAFESCTSLTSITIPISVTRIGGAAFNGCSSLTSIQVASNNPCFCSCDSHLYSKDMKTLVRYAPGCKNTTFTIPSSVTSIGDWAFQGCTSLSSVTLLNSVRSIGDEAFKNCTSLKSITIPSSVTSIGDSAFQNCSSLTNITIPSSVTSIERAAFENCTSLTSIAIPSSVTSIENYAFEGCDSLTSVSYVGTMKQWSRIQLGFHWKDNAPFKVVHCTDGDARV